MSAREGYWNIWRVLAAGLFVVAVAGAVAWHKTDGFRARPLARPPDSDLAALLRKRDFGALERRLRDLHDRYAADVRSEELLTFAYRKFEDADDSLSGEFDFWVDAMPDSSHARIARAAHCLLYTSDAADE